MTSNQEMMDRISQLTMAIQQQRNNISNGYRGSSTTFRPPYRPNNVYRPNVYRPPTTTYRPNVYRPPPASTYRPVYRPSYHTRPPSYPQQPAQQQPQKSHHRQLINQKNNTIVKSVDPSTGRQQVSVNGVEFVVKGKKLVRKDVLDKSNILIQNAPKYLVRKTIKSKRRLMNNSKNKVFIRGPEGYIRQGRKSLVLKSNQTRQKKPTYCGFYTRYGRCPNGDRCLFRHDRHRRAICPRFLQGKCTKAACSLSHTPNDHIMPHCVHFQKGHCTKENCLYAHVRVNPESPVCKPFAMEGYCPRGLGCDEKHIHVCPEFAETGKCSNANCRLPHVAKRKGKEGTGIVRLSSWVSPRYLQAQKFKMKVAQEAVQQTVSPKVWFRDQQQQQEREKGQEKEDEEEGFVRLFDDEDDDGWSQYAREDESEDQVGFLRFKDDDEEAEEEEEEEEEEEVGSDMEEVYEEVPEGEEGSSTDDETTR
ncbi:hypothetical protein G6F43_000449 [Rhizopus delemar]|nr:hypothetical protein G6F43_000449 [Rhizopus delemar]